MRRGREILSILKWSVVVSVGFACERGCCGGSSSFPWLGGSRPVFCCLPEITPYLGWWGFTREAARWWTRIRSSMRTIHWISSFSWPQFGSGLLIGKHFLSLLLLVLNLPASHLSFPISLRLYTTHTVPLKATSNYDFMSFICNLRKWEEITHRAVRERLRRFRDVK